MNGAKRQCHCGSLFQPNSENQVNCPSCMPTRTHAPAYTTPFPTPAEEAMFQREREFRRRLHARFTSRYGDPSLNAELLDLLAGGPVRKVEAA